MTHAQLLDFAKTGRVWLRQAISRDERQTLCAAGVKNGRLDADHPLFEQDKGWLDQVRALWPAMRPVRAVGFDKRAGSNWSVPWHQDRVIAVKDRREAPGFSGWSQKAGVWHCSPPMGVLRQMLFLRLHLDACSAENGAMEIALGSHRAGLVAASEAAQVAGRYATEVTEAAAGDVLVLSMLVLHRSCSSRVDAARRTLRVDLADRELPFGLEWAM